MHPFTRRTAESVSAFGEEKLIVAIRGWLGAASPRAPFGIGDDCAVLPPSRGRQLITVDPVIHGRHFDDAVPPAAVGAKLLKRNLSDLAAMGGRPSAAVLALTLDPMVRVDWLRHFYRGLATCALEYGVPIVGGDVAQADGMVAASLTLLGNATGPRTITRTGARIGDCIYVTGRLGRSLQTGHHYRFTPRLEEGAWLARRREVQAMMDISDGLAKDLRALTPARAAAELVATAVPRRRGATLAQALSDGEDYELVFAVRARTDSGAMERDWRRAFPRVPLTCIGQFVNRGSLRTDAVDLGAYRGYEHLHG